MNQTLDRQASLKLLYDSPGWKIYEEDVIGVELIGTNYKLDKLLEEPVKPEDLPVLNGLIANKAFLNRLLMLNESLKEEAKGDIE